MKDLNGIDTNRARGGFVMTRNTIGGFVLFAALAVVGDAIAARGPKLRLGHVRAAGNGVVAVPVELVAPRGHGITALNFDLRYDPTAVTAGDVTAGPAVTDAGAELAARANAADGTVRAIVLPVFGAEMPPLRGRQVATVQLTVRGRGTKGLGRWLRRRLHLERVVLADGQGREIPQASRNGR